MIEEIKGYVLSCDICGAELEDDSICPVYNSEDDAREAARDAGWVEYEPGKFACESCAETNNKEEYETAM